MAALVGALVAALEAVLDVQVGDVLVLVDVDRESVLVRVDQSVLVRVGEIRQLEVSVCVSVR